MTVDEFLSLMEPAKGSGIYFTYKHPDEQGGFKKSLMVRAGLLNVTVFGDMSIFWLDRGFTMSFQLSKLATAVETDGVIGLVYTISDQEEWIVMVQTPTPQSQQAE